MTRARKDGFALLCRLLDAALLRARGEDAGARVEPPRRIDWRAVIGISGTNLVTPLLGHALETLGLLGALEDEPRLYFRAMMDAARDRNRVLRRDLLRVAVAMGRAGIPLLPLKGAIRLVDGLYEDDSWRFMHDLDLLVPADRLAAAARILEEGGWRYLDDKPCRLDPHLPPMVHPDSGAVLELHGRAVSAWLDHMLPAADLFAGARPSPVEDTTLLLPAPTDQLLHLVIHGQLMHGHLYTGRLLLRDLVELVRLAHRHGSGMVEEVLRRLEPAGHRLAGEVAVATARATLPNAAATLPPARPAARLLASKAIAQQRSGFLMATLAPVGAVLRERRAHARSTGLLRRLADAGYRRDLRDQWQAFRRKTSW